MNYLEIKKELNILLNGELVPWKRLIGHINYAIDAINTDMNTCFPTISVDSSADDLGTEYTAIPDKYIRTVILPGAAHHYYMVDDEGTTPEIDFAREFAAGKFYMLRDYSCSVPAQYRVQDNEDGSFAGSVESTYEDSNGLRGIERGNVQTADPTDPLSWVGEIW
jgi:hypothetical protein